MATYGPAKLEPKAHGPCEAAQAFASGAAKAQRGEAEEEIASIRKLFPHKEPSARLAQERLLRAVLGPAGGGPAIARESAGERSV